jgi:hypothetical protein
VRAVQAHQLSPQCSFRIVARWLIHSTPSALSQSTCLSSCTPIACVLHCSSSAICVCSAYPLLLLFVSGNRFGEPLDQLTILLIIGVCTAFIIVSLSASYFWFRHQVRTLWLPQELWSLTPFVLQKIRAKAKSS